LRGSLGVEIQTPGSCWVEDQVHSAEGTQPSG
jgi:hypothetical protein